MADTDSRWYTTTPSIMATVLDKIPSLGTPEKANSAWLATIGHGGGNAQSIIRVLKNVRLVESDGTPSNLWPRFKGGDRKALAEGVRAGYAQLFAVYPDAQQKDAEALISFFRSNTQLGDGAQRMCVQTFQKLAAAADFSEPKEVTLQVDKVEAPTGESDTPSHRGRSASRTNGFGLTVNIQLQLPPSTDGEVYDKLFEAMAKHLGGFIDSNE